MIKKILSVLLLIIIGAIIWGEYILLHGFFDSALSGSVQYLITYLILFVMIFILFVFTDIIVFAILLGAAVGLWEVDNMNNKRMYCDDCYAHGCDCNICPDFGICDGCDHDHCMGRLTEGDKEWMK